MGLNKMNKPTLLALAAALTIFAAPVDLNAASPKKKPRPLPPPPRIERPLPPRQLAPPERLEGCGSVWADEVKSPLYRALSEDDGAKSFAWNHPLDTALPANTLIERRVQFEGTVKFEESYNSDDHVPLTAEESKTHQIALSTTVHFGWYECKIDGKGIIVLTEKDTGKVLRFKPTMDAKRKTVLHLTSEKDGSILKRAKPTYPAPTMGL